MVPLFLLLIWVAVLLPPFIRSRMERDPVDSVGEFRRHLRLLESATPLPSSSEEFDELRPMPTAWAQQARRAEVLRRRRFVARVLLGSMGVTLIAGLVPGLHVMLLAHLFVDAVFIGYLTLLVQARRRAMQRHDNPYNNMQEHVQEDDHVVVSPSIAAHR